MRLLTFLGTGDYVPVHYTTEQRPSVTKEELQARVDAGSTTRALRKFVQTAIAELAGRGAISLTVLATEDARKKHWEGLQSELGVLPEGRVADVKIAPILNATSTDQLWKVFASVVDAVPEGEDVMLDITHGFRSLPYVGVLALAFARQVRNFRLEGVTYGAFEALGDPRVVRAAVAAGDPVFDAPLLDLTAMMTLPAWAEAVSEWRRTGRADGLNGQSKSFVAGLRLELRQDAPKQLVGLPGRLMQLSGLLSLVHHERPGNLARALRVELQMARPQIAERPALKPLMLSFDLIDAELGELESAVPEGAWKDGTPDYLRQQLALARWYAKKHRVVEAFSVLRELTISSAVNVAVQADIRSMPRGGKSKPALRSADSADFRTLVGQAVSAISGASQHAPGDDPKTAQLRTQLGEGLLAKFRAAIVAVETRNKLDHCWLGIHSREKTPRGTFGAHEEELEAAIDACASLVDSLAPDPTGSVPDQKRDGFVNLSNHPLAQWTPEQVSTSATLGHGEPVELDGGMPTVDPEFDTRQVKELADTIVGRVLQQGAAAAHVAGEPTLTACLVRELQAQDIRCFCATTERAVGGERSEADGARVTTKVFKFVRWREFPDSQ